MAESTRKTGIARPRSSVSAALLLAPSTEADLRIQRVQRRLRIINNAIELARIDEKARLLLLEELQILGKGKRGRRMKDDVPSRVRRQQVTGWMEVLKAHDPTKSMRWMIGETAKRCSVEVEVVERIVRPRSRKKVAARK